MLELRPYQREAIAAIEAAASRGLHRLLLALPTGTGKTVIFAELLRQRGGLALVLAHRDELIRQAVDKLRLVMPTMDIGIIQAGQNEVDADLLVASVQTVCRARRLVQLPTGISTLVVDEGHHAPAASYRRVIDHVRPELLLGVTATPDRGDGLGLESVFDEIVYTKTLLEMIEAGYLSNLTAKRIRLAGLDLDTVHTRAGDLDAGELAEALVAVQAPDLTARAYVDHALGRPALVFTGSVQLAYQTADALRTRGVRAAAIDGGLPRDERRRRLHQLHVGELDVIANCQVTTEGFDEPRLSCIVIARPTKSRPLYAQMVGRGTRLYPGKDECLILDLVGATSRHELVTLATLVGVSQAALAQEGDVVGAAAADRRAKAAPSHADLVADAVNLFDRHRLHWASPSGDLFVLSLGTAGSVRLTTTDHERWTVTRVHADRVKDQLAMNLPLSYAQGIAEDLVRQFGTVVLNDPTARWRRDPPTEKQLRTLQKFRVPIPPGCTKGEAKDLLDVVFARF